MQCVYVGIDGDLCVKSGFCFTSFDGFLYCPLVISSNGRFFKFWNLLFVLVRCEQVLYFFGKVKRAMVVLLDTV